MCTSVPRPKTFHHDTCFNMEIFGMQYDVIKRIFDFIHIRLLQSLQNLVTFLENKVLLK